MTRPALNLDPDLLAAIYGPAIRSTMGTPHEMEGLARQLVIAEATTPARQAAFLTAVAHASGFAPGATAPAGEGRYRARGFLRLEGIREYRRAGDHFNVDLANRPQLAADRAWSARLARWRWLDRVPMVAVDDHDFATVLRRLGLGDLEDSTRADYQRALHALAAGGQHRSTGG